MRTLLALLMVSAAATPARSETVELSASERAAFLSVARDRSERVARDLRGEALPAHVERAPREVADLLAAFISQPGVAVDRTRASLDPDREIAFTSDRERARFWMMPATDTFGPSQGYFVVTDRATGETVRELAITAGGSARRPYLRRAERIGSRIRATAEQYEPLPGRRWMLGDLAPGERSRYYVLGPSGRRTRISPRTAKRLINLPTAGMAKSGVHVVIRKDGRVRFRRSPRFDPEQLRRETRTTFVPRRGRRAAHVRRLPRR